MPSMFAVHHAGGGKASQHVVRGFDGDHGTDVTLCVDGVPVNMVSHAHGQGYADPPFSRGDASPSAVRRWAARRWRASAAANRRRVMVRTDPLVKALTAEGYVVARSVLSGAEIAMLRQAFETAPTEESGTVHVYIDDTTPGAEAWRALDVHPLLERLATPLLGRWRVRGAHGRGPLPGYGEQGLHADCGVPDPAGPPPGLTFLWLLDPFTADNGATRVVPGSQRWRVPPKRLAQPGARHGDERVMLGDPGDVLVFDTRLWHAGRRNGSAGPRRIVQMVVLPA